MRGAHAEKCGRQNAAIRERQSSGRFAAGPATLAPFTMPWKLKTQAGSSRNPAVGPSGEPPAAYTTPPPQSLFRWFALPCRNSNHGDAHRANPPERYEIAIVPKRSKEDARDRQKGEAPHSHNAMC